VTINRKAASNGNNMSMAGLREKTSPRLSATMAGRNRIRVRLSNELR